LSNAPLYLITKFLLGYVYEPEHSGKLLLFTFEFRMLSGSFYRAFNCIFGKVGRVAYENVVIELMKTKCYIPRVY